MAAVGNADGGRLAAGHASSIPRSSRQASHMGMVTRGTSRPQTAAVRPRPAQSPPSDRPPSPRPSGRRWKGRTDGHLLGFSQSCYNISNLMIPRVPPQPMTDALTRCRYRRLAEPRPVYSKGTNAGGCPPPSANTPKRRARRPAPILRAGRSATWRRCLALLAVVCAVGLYSIEATHFHHTLAEQLQCPCRACGRPQSRQRLLRRSLHPTSVSRGGARRSISR